MRTSAHGGRRLVGRTRYARVVAMSEITAELGRLVIGNATDRRRPFRLVLRGKARPRAFEWQPSRGTTLEGDRRAGRAPDPQRMEMAYRQSAVTLNLLRAFAQGGFTNLDNVNFCFA